MVLLRFMIIYISFMLLPCLQFPLSSPREHSKKHSVPFSFLDERALLLLLLPSVSCLFQSDEASRPIISRTENVPQARSTPNGPDQTRFPPRFLFDGASTSLLLVGAKKLASWRHLARTWAELHLEDAERRTRVRELRPSSDKRASEQALLGY